MKAVAATLFYDLDPRRSPSGSPESLISYVRRLADAHRVVPKRLLEILGTSCINGSNPKDWIGGTRDTGQLHGALRRAHTLAASLEIATSVKNLQAHTFTPLSSIIARNGIGGMSPTRKWCPECLREQRSSGAGLFDLLCWAPQAVISCSRHLTLLDSACPQCGRGQRFLTARPDITQCHWCGGDLLRPKNTTLLAHSDSRMWIARQIDDLLSDPEYALVPYRKDAVYWFLNTLSRVSNFRLTEIGELAGLDGVTVHGWGRSRHRPTLQYLLWLLLSAKIPLRLLLRDPEAAANQAFAFGIEQAPPWLKAKRRVQKRKWDHAQVRFTARKILANNPRASAARLISRSLGVPEGTIRYICADLLHPTRRPELSARSPISTAEKDA